MFVYEGAAFVFGDNINTDYIISSHRKKENPDMEAMKNFIMEDIRPGFVNELGQSNIIVAGENFGCGSAMEVAAGILIANNIKVVIASSFSRSFYRNAVNNGILAISLDIAKICREEILRVVVGDSIAVVDSINSGFLGQASTYSGIAKEIFDVGGVIPYMNLKNRKRQNFKEEF